MGLKWGGGAMVDFRPALVAKIGLHNEKSLRATSKRKMRCAVMYFVTCVNFSLSALWVCQKDLSFGGPRQAPPPRPLESGPQNALRRGGWWWWVVALWWWVAGGGWLGFAVWVFS